MANLERVTLDKSFFEALLRRADFHTSTQGPEKASFANVTISRAEYDSLLRLSQEYEHLKNQLLQGGLPPENLDLLISGAQHDGQRNDSGVEPGHTRTQNLSKESGTNSEVFMGQQPSGLFRNAPSDPYSLAPVSNLSGGSGALKSRHERTSSHQLSDPALQRNVSHGVSTLPETNFSDGEGGLEDQHLPTIRGEDATANERRTIILSGFSLTGCSENTQLRDVLSVIKGGKVLNVNVRSGRSATVTFADGASEFFAWSKRNDIYLHSKRVEVRWADRQYQMKRHLARRVDLGLTRNIVIHSAADKGLTEASIRADMEHIHNLVIIDVSFRAGDAYVSTNSIQNALYAKTCMTSRTQYKGCKIECFRDECDVPLPVRMHASTLPRSAPVRRKTSGNTNRFDWLKLDRSIDQENRAPSEENSEDE